MIAVFWAVNHLRRYVWSKKVTAVLVVALYAKHSKSSLSRIMQLCA